MSKTISNNFKGTVIRERVYKRVLSVNWQSDLEGVDWLENSDLGSKPVL